MYLGIEGSNDKFYFDSLNTDIGSDNGCFESIYTSDSNSDIVPSNK